MNEILAKVIRDQNQSQLESNNKPVGSMSSRTGGGEGEDRTFRSSEGAQLSAVCPTALHLVGKPTRLTWEGARCQRYRSGRGIVLEEGSTIPCFIQAVTGLREVVGMR
jgi:hypothetical protein